MKKMNFLQIFSGYWILLHPYTSLTVSTVTVLLIYISDFNSSNLFLLRIGFIMLLIQFSIGVSNDVLDQVFDQQAKRHKPIISGLVNPLWARVLFIMLVITAIMLSFSLGFRQLWILLLGLSCGLLYNLGLKRTFFSWLPLAVAIPTLLFWTMTLTSQHSSLIYWSYFLGLFLGPAINLANQIDAAEAAADSGEKSLIHYLGIKNSSRICSLLFITTALFINLIMFFNGPVHRFVIICTISATIFTLIFLILSERDYKLLLWPLALLIGTFLGISWVWVLSF